MVEQSIDQEARSRCEAACRKLEEAIEDLDGCGFDLYATHAHLCLELVREQLNLRDEPVGEISDVSVGTERP
jgi:hypothetical protein